MAIASMGGSANVASQAAVLPGGAPIMCISANASSMGGRTLIKHGRYSKILRPSILQRLDEPQRLDYDPDVPCNPPLLDLLYSS
jgi:hypothetical protein